MNRTEQLELIRSKCVEVNPSDLRYQGRDIPVKPATIRLADVLLMYTESVDKWTNKSLQQVAVRWNWRKDDLNEQSDETVAFLADLLASN